MVERAPVLFPKATWEGLADGSITVAFRSWKRPTVKAGGTLRTRVGLLAIDEVTRIDLDEVTDEDARRAGHPDADGVRQLLASRPEGQPYRIRFRHAGDDPRDTLAADADLSPEDLADLRRRLHRMDARGSHGPWTRRVLEVIDANPEVVSTELAAQLDWERFDFKAHVRRLKALGLTISHPVGYRLSPRGRAFLAAEQG